MERRMKQRKRVGEGGALVDSRGGQRGTHTHTHLLTDTHMHTYPGGWVVVRDSWA